MLGEPDHDDFSGVSLQPVPNGLQVRHRLVVRLPKVHAVPVIVSIICTGERRQRALRLGITPCKDSLVLGPAVYMMRKSMKRIPESSCWVMFKPCRKPRTSERYDATQTHTRAPREHGHGHRYRTRISAHPLKMRCDPLIPASCSVGGARAHTHTRLTQCHHDGGERVTHSRGRPPGSSYTPLGPIDRQTGAGYPTARWGCRWSRLRFTTKIPNLQSRRHTAFLPPLRARLLPATNVERSYVMVS